VRNLRWSVRRGLLRLGDYLLDAAYQHRASRILGQCASVGTHVRLRMPTIVYQPEKISIGNFVDIGEFVVLRGAGGLTIGDRVLIAAQVTITTAGHSIRPPRYNMNEFAPILIEDDVWVGAGAIILPGVTVGSGAIIAAGSVVSRSVEPRTIVGGVPARLIGAVPEVERQLN